MAEHKHIFGPWYDCGKVWKDGNGQKWQPICRKCTCGQTLYSNKAI